MVAAEEAEVERAAPPVGGGKRADRPPARRRPTSAIPAFATKNTTRIGGADPAANAAARGARGVPLHRALAAPRRGDPGRRGRLGRRRSPAAVLMAAPGAGADPRLRRRSRCPRRASKRSRALDPAGSRATGGAAVLRDRRRRRPGGPERDARRAGAGPAASAAAVARLRDRLFGSPPKHVVDRPGEGPAFAMPAAAWAARSGDPVLFAEPDRLPGATATALRRYRELPVFVLGPSSAISSDVVRRDRQRSAPRCSRVAGEDPVSQRDRPRPLLRRRLRLERQRPRPRLRRRPQRPAARRRRRVAALGLGDLGAAAAHRRRRYASGGLAQLPARRQARLHGRPDARLLQPRVGDRRPGGDRSGTTG